MWTPLGRDPATTQCDRHLLPERELGSPPGVVELHEATKAAAIAVLITGRLAEPVQPPSLPTRLHTLRELLGQIGRAHTDVYLSTDDPAPTNGGLFALACELLHPVWTQRVDWLAAPLPAANCRLGTGRICQADDSADHSTHIGCYADGGRACAKCNTSKYFAQFGRLLHAWRAARERERARGLPYAWAMRIRTDARGAPSFLPPFDPDREWSESKMPNHTVYGFGLAGNGLRPPRPSYIGRDMFFIVPRGLADRFFAVALSFLGCQSRRAHKLICGVDHEGEPRWYWGAPECVLKAHLLACGLGHMRTTLPWASAIQASSLYEG